MSSHSKTIALELIYKTKGIEQKITISPAHRTLKKSVEWLRALKKVKRLKKEKKLLWFLMMEGVPSVGSGLYCTVPLESGKYSDGVHRILICRKV